MATRADIRYRRTSAGANLMRVILSKTGVEILGESDMVLLYASSIRRAIAQA